LEQQEQMGVLVTDNHWVVLAEYLFALGDSTATSMQLKGVAVAAYTVAVLGLFCQNMARDYLPY
jgi:pyruvate/2-oxoglutarate dehydrogenase complex dihydrolipoamide dehydrogenase (E3) component